MHEFSFATKYDYSVSQNIKYKGEDLFLSLKINIKKNEKFRFEFEKTDSKYVQGFKIDFNKKDKIVLNINNVDIRLKPIITEDTAPKDFELCLKNLKGESTSLYIYNIWKNSDGKIQYGQGGASMKIKKIKNGWRCYCNDGDLDDDFDDLIFTVKKIT